MKRSRRWLVIESLILFLTLLICGSASITEIFLFFKIFFNICGLIYFQGRFYINEVVYFDFFLKKEDMITILQERKIIINSVTEGESWQLNHMAQPVQHPAQAPPSTSESHTHTYGLPHQDTVLHMNSGSNSILLRVHQQINRSSRVTGNHILDSNWRLKGLCALPQLDEGLSVIQRLCEEANAPTVWCVTSARRSQNSPLSFFISQVELGQKRQGVYIFFWENEE